MPRKLCSVVLVLAVALSTGLTCQAAHAAPSSLRSANSNASGGAFLGSLWNWLAERADLLGTLMTGQTGQGLEGQRKDTGASDPNGSANYNGKPCGLGTGGTIGVGSIQP